MSGTHVRAARKAKGLTQAALAKKLGVSQGFVSLLERNHRSVSGGLVTRLAALLEMPPTTVPVKTTAPLRTDEARRLLGTLGYEGFQYLKTYRCVNPAEVLLRALGAEVLDGRVAKALPWLLVQYPDLNWNWLVSEAKQQDLQNRLGFMVSLARAVAESRGRDQAAATLSKWEHKLEESRLLKLDPLSSGTQAEQRWLREHRSAEARHWNVLSTLNSASLLHAG